MTVVSKALRLILWFLTPQLAGCYDWFPYNGRTLIGPGPTGFISKTLSRGDRVRNYALFIPKHCTPQSTHKFPAIIFLHDIGEGGSSIRSVLYVGLAPCVDMASATFPFIVIFPQSTNGKWDPDSENALDVIAELDEVSRMYPVDPDRVSLTGIGTGGYGTWAIGAKYANRFAALAPMASSANDTRAASQLMRLPIRAYHNKDDWFAQIRNDEVMIDAIRKLGGDAELITTDGPGHDCWEIAFGESDLLPWLQKQHRPTTRPQ